MNLSSTNLLIAKGWDEYSIIDSGNGRKLEQFKNYLIDRPEPKALWSKSLSEKLWQSADAIFHGTGEQKGEWLLRDGKSLQPWVSSYHGVSFMGKLTSFKNIGYFPEKQPLWDLMQDYLTTTKGAKVLNLFAYTGVATLLAAKLGAAVTHIDASSSAISWAKENQKLSKLEDKPIRWICEDASKFVARQVHKNNKYNLILLDPPTFGRGPNKQIWNIAEHLISLLQMCEKILEKKNALLILNTYSNDITAAISEKFCKNIFLKPASLTTINNAVITSGELAVQQQNSKTVTQSTFSIIKYK